MSLYEVTAPVGEVCLIPAHSSYGAVSMRRYWSSLISQVREGDPYHFHTIMEPGDARNHPGFMGKAQRYLARRWTYPRLIRKSTSGAIAHVLDHSWADMLPHIPKGVLRVITVHDLFPLTVPGELPAHQVKRFRSTTRHIHSADVITAVSEYTKGELCRELGIDPAVVTVIPNGVDHVAEARAREAGLPAILGRVLPEKTLMIGSIGSAAARKNLGILPEALGQFRKISGLSPVLIRVGQKLPVALADAVRGVVGAEGLVELGLIPDRDLGAFYRSVDLVVIPSTHEGFGLPVLESMAHGTPVICSNSTSLPEVGGNAPLYFTPNQPAELVAQLRIFVESPGLADRMIAAGRLRASAFSWRTTLEAIYQLYGKGPRHPRGFP